MQNSTLVMNKAYNRIPLTEASREYTAFAINGSKNFEWLVMTFCVTNTPAAFYEILDRVSPEFDKYSGRYLDDVSIAMLTFELYLEWLRKVIVQMHDIGFTLNKWKCDFCVRSVVYLGF